MASDFAVVGDEVGEWHFRGWWLKGGFVGDWNFSWYKDWKKVDFVESVT